MYTLTERMKVKNERVEQIRQLSSREYKVGMSGAYSCVCGRAFVDMNKHLCKLTAFSQCDN